jgi:hypothetical protein
MAWIRTYDLLFWRYANARKACYFLFTYISMSYDTIANIPKVSLHKTQIWNLKYLLKNLLNRSLSIFVVWHTFVLFDTKFVFCVNIYPLNKTKPFSSHFYMSNLNRSRYVERIYIYNKYIHTYIPSSHLVTLTAISAGRNDTWTTPPSRSQSWVTTPALENISALNTKSLHV